MYASWTQTAQTFSATVNGVGHNVRYFVTSAMSFTRIYVLAQGPDTGAGNTLYSPNSWRLYINGVEYSAGTGFNNLPDYSGSYIDLQGVSFPAGTLVGLCVAYHEHTQWSFDNIRLSGTLYA